MNENISPVTASRLGVGAKTRAPLEAGIPTTPSK